MSELWLQDGNYLPQHQKVIAEAGIDSRFLSPQSLCSFYYNHISFSTRILTIYFCCILNDGAFPDFAIDALFIVTE